MGEHRMTKKVWEKPKLIILIRSRPEESVLTACKTSTAEGPAGNRQTQCFRAPCRDCSALTTS